MIRVNFYLQQANQGWLFALFFLIQTCLPLCVSIITIGNYQLWLRPKHVSLICNLLNTCDVPFVFWGDGGLKVRYLRGKQIIKNPSDCENGSVLLESYFFCT